MGPSLEGGAHQTFKLFAQPERTVRGKGLKMPEGGGRLQFRPAADGALPEKVIRRGKKEFAGFRSRGPGQERGGFVELAQARGFICCSGGGFGGGNDLRQERCCCFWHRRRQNDGRRLRRRRWF